MTTRKSSQHGGNAPPRRTCTHCGFVGTRGVSHFNRCKNREACERRAREAREAREQTRLSPIDREALNTMRVDVVVETMAVAESTRDALVAAAPDAYARPRSVKYAWRRLPPLARRDIERALLLERAWQEGVDGAPAPGSRAASLAAEAFVRAAVAS